MNTKSCIHINGSPNGLFEISYHEESCADSQFISCIDLQIAIVALSYLLELIKNGDEFSEAVFHAHMHANVQKGGYRL